jgi:hypothetical protein
MKSEATNQRLKWVQMTPKNRTAFEPMVLRRQVQNDEPAPLTQTANEINGFTAFRFKVQTGFKLGSLNPIRFIGSRAYMKARNVNLALNGLPAIR